MQTSLGNFVTTTGISSTRTPRPRRESVYFDLIKLKIFHQITQENPGSRNI
uniref:Isoleucyl tRNA synthetase n=1 Tax=Rattus norvegicus TaxID=10116 RepID=O35880_RAT|nr:isoleucyl tRNA synthetase [Rattus norvegicus]